MVSKVWEGAEFPTEAMRGSGSPEDIYGPTGCGGYGQWQLFLGQDRRYSRVFRRGARSISEDVLQGATARAVGQLLCGSMS